MTTDSLTAWKHVANEWADMAINGLQHARNVADGMTMSTSAEIRENMEACAKHCMEVQNAAHEADKNRGTPVNQTPRYERMLRIAKALHERSKCTEEELKDPKMYALKRDLGDASLALMLDIQLVQVPIIDGGEVPFNVPGGFINEDVVAVTKREWSLDLHGQPDSVGGSF